MNQRNAIFCIYNNSSTTYKQLFILIVITFTISACGGSLPFAGNTSPELALAPLSGTQKNSINQRIRRLGIPTTGMSVLVLGSGGPDGADHERASAGYVVFIDGQAKILMDTGGGSYERLNKSGINIKDLQYILLSHLHIDHTSDLSAIIKLIYFQNRIAGTVRDKPFHIYGPDMNGIPFPNTTIPQYPSTSYYINQHYDMKIGTERYLNLFTKAIGAGEFNYIAHDLPSNVSTPVTEILNKQGLVIESIAVNHGPVPSVAFRLSYKNKRIVYSGDTTSVTDNMISISQDVDLVFYDTAITDTLPGDIISKLHTTPTRMGQVAAAANVKMLVLTHLTGTTLPRLKEVEASIRAQNFIGEIEEAEDLEIY